ncbi:transposase family protein [Streptomyces sp. 11-1-2]|uniref:transposase family protein n=1 Tax=unclassified Streptomyces TaxID=2593676 RepID=UPI001F09B430|nr:transposase family protein [Streptomyces sp. 11-1-2]
MNEVLYRLQELLFPSIPGVAVVAMRTDGEALLIEARCTPSGAACPDCTQWTERVHSSYLRFPADLPTSGRRVQLALRVRRFLCTAEACRRRTFAEQVPGLTRRHGRVTERLRQAMGAIGLALAGRAGARLAHSWELPPAAPRCCVA